MKGATCRKFWKTEIQSCQEKRNQTSKKKKKKPTKNKQTKNLLLPNIYVIIPWNEKKELLEKY